METTNKDTIIIRVEHFYEKGDDPKLSKPIVIRLKGIFNGFEIMSLTEHNLSANQLLKEKMMLKWKTDEKKTTESDPCESDKDICLKPMEIRTFVAKIVYS